MDTAPRGQVKIGITPCIGVYGQAQWENEDILFVSQETVSRAQTEVFSGVAQDVVVRKQVQKYVTSHSLLRAGLCDVTSQFEAGSARIKDTIGSKILVKDLSTPYPVSGNLIW